MLVEKKGNLVDAFINGHIDILAHGTNCRNGFGSGIAGEISKKIPHVKRKFHEAYDSAKKVGVSQLGTMDIIESHNGFVVNCYTQDRYGYDGRCYMDYEAMDKIMKHLACFASSNSLTVGLPRIGCGLAGGDWIKVKDIIETNFSLYNAKAVVYTL